MNTPEKIKNKIHSQESIYHLLQRQRFFKKKIVFTNGVFDLLHLGHVDYLAKAADHGKFFIVGMNSDASVKLLNKGSARPLQDETSRATVLAALGFVDAVILFDEETPLQLIEYVQPDVLVKGADYKANEVVGHDIVIMKGGEVKLIEFVEGYSTTAIEKKIRDSK